MEAFICRLPNHCTDGSDCVKDGAQSIACPYQLHFELPIISTDAGIDDIEVRIQSIDAEAAWNPSTVTTAS